MPLASSREAAKKRAERAAADVRELRRRESLSLPMTIDSSTKVTEAKLIRRRSARRDSIASFKAQAKQQRLKKENTPPRIPKSKSMLENYSPPLTRSAKKQRYDGDDTQSLVLTFSPPDQEENARREQNEKELKEMAR